MSQSIHGHEVMHMMLELGGDFSAESLKAAMHQRFGESARYHTCSAEDLDADALIVFLREKGKFVDSEAGFNTREEHICNH